MSDIYFTTEYLERYLAGELSDTEQTAFEKAMDAQPKLEEAFRRHMLARAAVFHTAKEEWRDNKRQKLREWRAEEKQTSSVSWYQMAAAIALLLAIGLGIYFLQSRQSSPEELFLAYYEVDAAPNTRNQASESELYKGYQAFNQQNYEEALMRWDNIPADQLDNFTTNELTYYRGLSYLELGRTTEAIQQLNQIQDSDFSDRATWYLALIWLKEGEADRARPLIQSLARRASPYQSKAKEVLKQLEE